MMGVSLAQRLHSFNQRAYPLLVWLLRILIGGTFIFSGFAKCIDPLGFVIKIQEYLNVWGIGWLWRETVVCIAVCLSTVEFCAGFMVLTGCLRRGASWLVLLIMAFMLPLTAYIVVASPVSYCGCFGDAFVISNEGTFVKNIFLTLGAIYLLFNNHKVAPIYPPLMQWMPIVASVFYCLTIAFVGLTIQPLMDFRPFKVGTPLLDDDAADIRLLYQKDGSVREFDVDALPDSTWTYVGRTAPHHDSAALAVYDSDGDEVTSDVISTDGAQILLVVPDVDRHIKARSSMANNVNDYVTSHGGSMIGLVGTDSKGLERWRQLAKPNFEVYTADDATLKSLVRGDAGLVYVYDDTIRWKRSIFSLSGGFPDFAEGAHVFDSVYVIDSGYPLAYITGCYVGLLVLLFLLGLIRIKNDKKKAENK